MTKGVRYPDERLLEARVAWFGDNQDEIARIRIKKRPNHAYTYVRYDSTFARKWQLCEFEDLYGNPEACRGPEVVSQVEGLEAPAQLCQLTVGGSKLSIQVHFVDCLASRDGDSNMEWDLDIGQQDLKVLESVDWETQVRWVNAECSLHCKDCASALPNGHARCLALWHHAMGQRGVEQCSCSEAARLRTADCLRYVHQHMRLPLDSDTCRIAVLSDSVACLAYAREHGSCWDDSIARDAAAFNSWACLQFILKSGEGDWLADTALCSAAAADGDLEALSMLHDQGCAWDADTCAAAARAGSLKCLVFLHELGCPWTSVTCAVAAANGSLGCLQYAYENGCPMHPSTCYEAASGGHLACLQYAHTHGPRVTCEPVEGMAQVAFVYYENMHITEGLWDGDSRSFARLINGALRSGGLECITYVHERMGCVWDASGSDCLQCFMLGEFEALQFIHMRGAPLAVPSGELLNDDVLEMVFVGRLRCLAYIHSAGESIPTEAWDTALGISALQFLEDTRMAVLGCFHRARKGPVGKKKGAAAHAVMQRVPADVIEKILGAAGLGYFDPLKKER